MITATPPWELKQEDEYDPRPPCPEDVIPDRELQRLDDELNERWWRYWQYGEDDEEA